MKKAKTRVVGYQWTADFDEAVIEKWLAKQKAAGIVSDYDTGRGHLVWLDGWPGPELRRVRDDLSAALGVRPDRRAS